MSGSKVTYYKNVNVDSVDLTIPEKSKGRYFSYLSLDHSPLFLQTPTLNIGAIDDNMLKLSIKKDGYFSRLLKSLDEHIIDYIFQRSSHFFRGSVFSRNKIASSFIPTIDNENMMHVQVTNPSKIFIKDQRDTLKVYDDITTETDAISILNIEGVAFTKNTIRLVITMHQMKIYVKEQLESWCIFNDSDSDADEIDEEEAEKEAEAIESAYESMKSLTHKTTPSPDVSNSNSNTENSNDPSMIVTGEISPDTEIELNSENLQQSTVSNDDDKDLF
jgi:hypothetical protein